MIRVEHLVTCYGRTRAVDDVSFHVRPGEAVALWGPNGAGKTTIIRSVLGQIRSRGSIVIDNHDARRWGKIARRRIGYVPQQLAFYEDLRLLEGLGLFAAIKRVGRDQPGELLERVGLFEHRRKRIRELSGGMKQRLALAMALLGDPPLLVLDEPTSSLDTQARASFIELLQAQRTRGTAMLFSSHRVGEVQAIADRVLLLREGKAVALCDPGKLTEMAELRVAIKLIIDHSRIDEAVAALTTEGYEARRNCRGVLVSVRPDEKARPMGILEHNNIAVSDFEIATAGDLDHTEPDRPAATPAGETP